MASDAAANRQDGWERVVRRSFGVSDVVAKDRARETLISLFQDELQVSGWHSAPRAVAQPLVDSLMVPEVIGDISDPTYTTEERARRLVAHGIGVVDPEHLAYDARSEYPPEIVAAAQQMLARVELYVRERPFGD